MSPALEGGLITTMKAHESLVFNSNEAMKILSLLFCFMFLDYFSIVHLNIWWAFLWPHLVTSHFAPLQSPSSFYSGLQAWLQLIFRVHVCVTCPDSTALGYMPLLWAPMGAVLTISVYYVPILWLLILFPHRFMSPGGDRLCLSVRSLAQDLWLWMFVKWMFKPSLTDAECLKVWH